MTSSLSIRQILLDPLHPKDVYEISQEEYAKELQDFRSNLLKSCSKWPPGYNLVGSPLPIIIPESLADHCRKIGELLDRAITNIVERWWSDAGAKFPERMPLLPQQESLLRWIDGPGKSQVPPFASRKGVWRPDVLHSHALESASTGESASYKPQICEINARFPFNGFFTTAFAVEIAQKRDLQALGLRPHVEPTKIFEAFLKLVDRKYPVHLLMGKADGKEIYLYEECFRSRFGLTINRVKPEDLRLVVDSNSSSGYTVYCARTPQANGLHTKGGTSIHEGEILEPIFQVGMELHQRELEELGEDMLKALAPICFSDFRTVHLVHDKRMLGIVLQELPSLVKDHKLLTPSEADILREGIIPTYLPGSNELRDLLRGLILKVESKDDYILKLVSSGKGKGIIFGTDLNFDEFIDILIDLTLPSGSGKLYVVQKLVDQAKFPVIVPNKDSRSPISKNAIVSLIMMVNGEQLGVGMVRTSTDRVCAVSRGGCWIPPLVSSGNQRHAIPSLRDMGKTSQQQLIRRIPILTLEQANDARKVARINTALQEDGVAILDLQFPDPESTYLLNLIKSLQANHNHGAPLTHSSTRGFFWDVRPTPATIGRRHTARSETTQDFPWHTDCSYVASPPQYFGLHVLQADRCGGGTLSVLRLSTLASHLDSSTLEVLSAPEFRIRVPPEFEYGTEAIIGPLFKQTADGLRCRFRADIIEPLTPRAKEAVEKLNALLADARSGSGENVALQLTPELLPNGSVILLDNARWFHARNQVKDKERHLRRIRWDAKDF